jgi:hypothetical protein
MCQLFFSSIDVNLRYNYFSLTKSYKLPDNRPNFPAKKLQESARQTDLTPFRAFFFKIFPFLRNRSMLKSIVAFPPAMPLSN